MNSDWRSLLVGEGLAIEEHFVIVTLRKGRHQRVRVSDEDESFALCAVAVRCSTNCERTQNALRAWDRNRANRLVGFRVDKRDRLIGEQRVPKVGLTADEFQFILRHFAAECDRLEFSMTGSDSE